MSFMVLFENVLLDPTLGACLWSCGRRLMVLGGEGFVAGDPAGHRDLDCGGSVVVVNVRLVALEALH